MSGFGGHKQINRLVCEYTKAKCTGFWTQYTGFRIASANALFGPEADGCQAEMNIVYHGYETRLAGANWWVPESNHSFEQRLLEEIAADLKK